MWGQEEILFGQQFGQRIIPTRVGTRGYQKYTDMAVKDHPHACGDKLKQITIRLGQLGSSPRVWGQAVLNRDISDLVRIIPTRVGTSTVKFIFITNRQDHPHACGDKRETVMNGKQYDGSSPRVWGQE